MRTLYLTFAGLALAPPATAQDQLWLEHLATSGYEWTRDLAPDGSGGVFAAGDTSGALGGPSSGSDYDVWLARHDGAGTQLWIRQYGTSSDDGAIALTSDGAGGTYGCGYTSGSFGGAAAGISDAWLGRFDGAGTALWLRQLGSPTTDFASAVAPDAAGGVYVAGQTHGGLAGPNLGAVRDAWIARYDGAGNQLWVQQIGTNVDDIARGVTADGTGGLYVCGMTRGSYGAPNLGSYDAWIGRFDSSGNPVWIRQIGSTAYDEAFSITSDGSGAVYVCGESEGDLGSPNPGPSSGWLARYDSAGNLSWVSQIGSDGFDDALAVSADGSGGVYLAGSAFGNLGGIPGGDGRVMIARYDSAGHQVWLARYGAPQDDSRALSVAWDGSGGVYAGGHSYDDFAGPNAGNADAWLGRFEGSIADSYCAPAVANSTSRPGVLGVNGYRSAAAGQLSLLTSDLPPNQFGYLLNSMTQGLVVGPGGSQGNLCLAGDIGRYVPGAGYPVLNSGPLGGFELAVDLDSTPTPGGLVPILAGQTWNFQAWYRDQNPGPTSNFTNAVSITFL